MNWSSWRAFLHMGGYGLYVWGTFGVSAVVVVLELVQLQLRKRRADRLVFDLEDGDETAQ